MPNYDEMDELLKSVKEYVDRLKSLAEVEESLRKYETDFDDISSRCDSLLEKTKEYVDSAASLNAKYTNIDNNINSVLNQYKNVGDAYDATRTKLDIFTDKEDAVADDVKNIKSMVSDFEKIFNNDNGAIQEVNQKLDNHNYRTTVLLGSLIGLVTILLIISVITLIMIA